MSATSLSASSDTTTAAAIPCGCCCCSLVTHSKMETFKPKNVLPDSPLMDSIGFIEAWMVAVV